VEAGRHRIRHQRRKQRNGLANVPWMRNIDGQMGGTTWPGPGLLCPGMYRPGLPRPSLIVVPGRAAWQADLSAQARPPWCIAGRARPLAFQARQAGWPINPPNTLPIYHPQIGCRENEGAPLLPAAGGRRPVDQGKEGANPMKGRRKNRGAELASH
jgi:hypothetical protein